MFHLILIPYHAGNPQYLGVYNDEEDIIIDVVKYYINDPIDILNSSRLNILPQNNNIWSICMYLLNENINFYVNSNPNSSSPINSKLWNEQALIYNKNHVLCSRVEGSVGAIQDDDNFKYPWYHGNIILEIPTFIWEKYNLNSQMFQLYD